MVDDQEANALLLQAVLARAGYTEVEMMTDPMAVVERCIVAPPDLLLLDWHMPGRGGPEILEEIHFLTDEPNWMPILVLTADITPMAKEKALSTGARDFLTKPLDATKVLLRIRNLLETRFLHLELHGEKRALEEKVAERTRELDLARQGVAGAARARRRVPRLPHGQARRAHGRDRRHDRRRARLDASASS